MAFLASLPGIAGWAGLALPGGFLILVTVPAPVSALSERPSRRQAAYRVLALILAAWHTQNQPDNLTPAPTGGR